MRTWIVAAALAVSCGSAAAQDRRWNDPTGRLSFDLADTGWVEVGRNDPASRILLNLIPEAVSEPRAPISRICILDYLHQPTDREIAQADANNALRVSAQVEQARSQAARTPFDEILITHQGIDVREMQNVEPNPATGEPMNRIRWSFVLSANRAMDFMGFVCAADQSLGPEAVAELRAIMRRMRISEQPQS